MHEVQKVAYLGRENMGQLRLAAGRGDEASSGGLVGGSLLGVEVPTTRLRSLW